MELVPETVIEEREHWTLAVNGNQDLLGKSLVVLRRECTAVIDVHDDEWSSLRHELRRVLGSDALAGEIRTALERAR